MSRAHHSPRVIGLTAISILVVGVMLLSTSCGGPATDTSSEPDPVVKIEKDGLLYTYHVPTDTEGLFEVRKDPGLLINLAVERKSETAWMRLLLEKELGVRDLRDLRADFDRTIRRLESLGYL